VDLLQAVQVAQFTQRTFFPKPLGGTGTVGWQAISLHITPSNKGKGI
jgi:hypothetical protein